MSALNDQILDVETQLLSTLESFQKPVVELAETISERVGTRLPVVDFGVRVEGAPQLRELLDAQFGFASKVLTSQRKFVNALFDATSPIEAKLVGEISGTNGSTPKTVKRTAKAAA